MSKPWSLKKLQPLPPVAAQLMRLVSAEDCSLQRISTLIRSDVAFSAEVLRIANSPLFGVRGTIGNLVQALAMLGMERVKSLAMTVALRNFLSSRRQDSVLRRCWRHSLACASACEVLAGAVGMNKDTIYTAGLLHDLGRMALLASYPAEYARMLEVSADHGYNILESERDVFDVDHCEAGMWLVREWALPQELERIAGHHHDEQPPERFDDLAVVQIACRLADALGFCAADVKGIPTYDELMEKLPPAVAQKLGPESDFAFKIGQQTSALERDLVI